MTAWEAPPAGRLDDEEGELGPPTARSGAVRAERLLHAVPEAPRPEDVVELYRRCGPLVYQVCRRLLRDREAARDATQEVFLKTFVHLKRTRTAGIPMSWVRQVATNHCLNLLRRRRQACGDDVEAHLETWFTRRTPGAAEVHLARRILARFDALTRAVAVAVIVLDMDYEQTADALGVSRRTVCRRLERFLTHSRKYLARSVP